MLLLLPHQGSENGNRGELLWPPHIHRGGWHSRAWPSSDDAEHGSPREPTARSVLTSPETTEASSTQVEPIPATWASDVPFRYVPQENRTLATTKRHVEGHPQQEDSEDLTLETTQVPIMVTRINTRWRAHGVVRGTATQASGLTSPPPARAVLPNKTARVRTRLSTNAS